MQQAGACVFLSARGSPLQSTEVPGGVSNGIGSACANLTVPGDFFCLPKFRGEGESSAALVYHPCWHLGSAVSGGTTSGMGPALPLRAPSILPQLRAATSAHSGSQKIP